MPRFHRRLLSATRLLVPLLLLTPSPACSGTSAGDAAEASQEAPPLLSTTIRETLDKDGIEAARKRFAEIWPEQSDAYRFDMEGLARLGGEYMQKGDFDRGQAVMEMVAAMTRASIEASLPEGMAAPGSQTTPERRETDGQRAERQARAVEPPLSDEVASRYEGIFRDPDETDPNHRFFLARDPCGPSIMFGAMWGDAQNTWLRLESESVLAQPPEQAMTGPPLRIEVTFGDDGRARSLSHDSTWFGSPLVRDGELPEAWRNQPCTRG